jgi:predicted GNAT family acetyltransferase
MRIVHDQDNHAFKAFDDNDVNMGNIAYSPHGDTLSATHTWTDSRFRGQGVAGKLLDALVEYARENGLKIIPVCSYVVAAFEKNPERYREVMKG